VRKRPCGSVRACVCACVCVRVCNCVCGVCMLASAYVCLDFMSKYILCLRAGYSATVMCVVCTFCACAQVTVLQ
jgi:hypothetical protein